MKDADTKWGNETYISSICTERARILRRVRAVWLRASARRRSCRQAQTPPGSRLTCSSHPGLQSLTEEAQKAVLLKQKIIEHFIPPDVAERLKKRAVYDEESGQWRLLSVAQAAVGGIGGRFAGKEPTSGCVLSYLCSDTDRLTKLCQSSKT